MWGVLSDERAGLSFASVTVSSNKSVVSMYNLRIFHLLLNVHTIYIRHLSVQAPYSRSCL
jgi:hypothetical protein